MRLLRRHGWMFASYYWLFVLTMGLPLATLMVMSFKDANFIGYPIRDWTFDWYAKIATDPESLRAYGFSIFVAVGSTLIALPVGTVLALIFARTRLPGHAIMFGMLFLPVITPTIIHAIALRIYARTLSLDVGALAVMLGHATVAVPFVTVLVLVRIRSMPRNIVEAARDLGASPVVAFRRVTVPYLMPALVGGTLIAMLNSLEDFVRSFFLIGHQPTLPVLIYTKLTSGFSPEITALMTASLVITAAVSLFAEFNSRRRRS
jgi:spermidine/putrescine transport system permease protein